MGHAFRTLKGAVTAMGAAAVISSCSQVLTRDDVLIRPARIAPVGSQAIQATVAQVVANPARVKVTDDEGVPVPNRPVLFTVTGGTVSPASATTNAAGEAQVSSWTMPTTAGTATLTATVQKRDPGDLDLATTFTAQLAAGAPATITGQPSAASATVNTSVTVTVAVKDQYGNGVGGVQVGFQSVESPTNAAVTSANPESTNSSGNIAVTWRLDTLARANTLRLSTVGPPQLTTTVSATGLAGAPTRVVAMSAASQSGVPSTAVGTPPDVRVSDRYGNVVPSTSVTFQPAAGSGTVTVGTCTNGTSCQASTGADGRVKLTAWTLGASMGTHTLNAFVTSVPTVAVSFTATATRDLLATGISAPSTGLIGDSIAVGLTVKNEGTMNAGAFRVAFYFSSNTLITTSDALAGPYCSIAGVTAGSTHLCNLTISVPSWLAVGAYYVGAIIDDQSAITESSESNNTIAASSTTSLAQPAPAAPSNLAVSVSGATQIHLTWDDNADDETGFRIERCSGASCTEFAEITTVFSNVTSYYDSFLSAGTSYSYRVRSYGTGGNSDYSNTATTTTPSIPTAPSNTAVTVVSSNQLTVTWTDNSSDETGFRVERCTGVSCTFFLQIATTAENVTTYASTGLSAGTSYSYRVLAFNLAGNSGFSATATNLTLSFGQDLQVTSLTAPASGTIGSTIQVSSTIRNFGDTPVGAFRVGYYFSTDATITTADTYSGSFCNITSLAAGAETSCNPAVSIPGSLAAGSYYVGALADDQFQIAESFESNNGRASASTTNVVPPPPTAPTTLSLTIVSGSQINLSWTDNSTNETGFRIERCSGASCSSFAEIATTGANATSYSNTGLTPGTSYTYRVRAYNTGGTSAYTNVSSATTPTLPAAPTGLTATAASTSQINLTWVDNATDETGFRIERCSGLNCTSYAEITTVAANVTSYPNTGLASGTYYSYRVRAYSAAGNSGYTNTATAVPPVTGIDLQVTAVSAPATGVTGEAASLSATYVNVGDTPAGAFRVGFYLSTNNLITTTDTYAGSCPVSSFAAGGSATCSISVTIPTSLSPGSYYAGAIADDQSAVSETNESNNALAAGSATTITSNAPSSLTATGVSTSQINLVWTDNSSNEDGFKVESCTGVSCSSYTQIATVGPNVTTYSHTPLSAGTTYGYRVRAYSGSWGNSSYSNAASTTTGLELSNGSFSSGTSAWTFSGNAYASTSFAEYRTAPGFAFMGTDATGAGINYASGTMYQTVAVPSGASSATLSFWYCITSDESTSYPYDKLQAKIQSNSGTDLTTWTTVSNQNKVSSCGSGGGYTQASFNIASYKGQLIRITFLGETDNVLFTTFRIDDVQLTWTP